MTEASRSRAASSAASPHHRTGWRALVPGVVIVTLIAAFTVAILVYARVGRLHGDKYRLYILTDAARGVIKGTEVWLAGQKVGLVTDIRFVPPGRDTLRRLTIELELLESVQEVIREDSFGQIRSGGSLIGAPVVYITPGTSGTPPLASGDTVRAKPQVDTEGLTSAVALAGRELPIVIREAKQVRDDMRRATSQLTELQDNGGVSLSVVGSRAARITERATRGGGVVPRLLKERTISARISGAMRSADTIRALLASDATSYGRFKRDSTLLREIASVRDEMSILRGLLEQSRGTAGRMANDKAVTDALASAEKELGRTIEDIKRDPLRYVRF
ncbi:MAG TPA: MlaD family protein [Gemmatimonadaceae bacterium]|nr:MlaD family protein [Gemmatimonadaceae bacterium]